MVAQAGRKYFRQQFVLYIDSVLLIAGAASDFQKVLAAFNYSDYYCHLKQSLLIQLKKSYLRIEEQDEILKGKKAETVRLLAEEARLTAELAAIKEQSRLRESLSELQFRRAQAAIAIRQAQEAPAVVNSRRDRETPFDDSILRQYVNYSNNKSNQFTVRCRNPKCKCLHKLTQKSLESSHKVKEDTNVKRQPDTKRVKPKKSSSQKNKK